ncbi:MAG: DUF6062 family protein [Thermoleophilia bacterium]
MSLSPLFSADLHRVLAAPDCPFCQLTALDDERYLRSVLREGLRTQELLQRLSAARGFCPEHAWALQRLERETWHDGLSNAFFAHALLEEALQAVEALPPTRPTSTHHQREVATAECPACAARARMQEITAAGFCAALADESFARLFAAREQGLCLPHFRLLWREALPAAVRQLLRDVQRRQLQTLLTNLGGYVNKHRSNVTEEMRPDEAASWRRAVEMLAGNERAKTGDGG